jgi:hypothetical protein
VRAKQEIMDYVSTLCRKGMSILFISSELPEVLRVSDRMVVMRDRKACGEYGRGELDETSVLHVIAGRRHEREPRPARRQARPRHPPSRFRTVLLQHPLLRPAAALLVLLLIDLLLVPGFFRLEIKDGHLYGSLVDILNRAAPLMLAALGMTLVIATRGIDISVGAVVALSGTVAAMLVGGTGGAAGTPMGWPWPRPRRGAAVRRCGTACWWPAGLQPIVATLILMVAGRGLAQLLTDGQIVTVYYQPFFFLGSGYLAGLPFSLFVVAAVFGHHAADAKTALGLFIQAVGINPVAARLAGLRTASAGHFRLRVLQRLRRPGGPDDQLEHQERGRQQRRPAAGAGRHPGRHAGRHLAGRRQVQPGGQHDRRADHPDADLHDLFAGRAARGEHGGQIDRRLPRLHVAVGRIQGKLLKRRRQEGMPS